jgi:hypothetical protein
MINLLWERMLEADLNQRYYAELATDYRRDDMNLKILIALMSSGSVAALAFWKETIWSHIWELLTALTTIAAVASPILNLSDKYQKSFNISIQFIDILSQYETLLARSKGMTDEEINAGMQKIHTKSQKVSADAFNLNTSRRKLKNKLQDIVIEARGLNKKKEE